MSPPTPSSDPFALHPDGSAVDPAAFRDAALADAAICRDLASDPDTRAVLESGDDGALQELLKAVFVVRGWVIKSGGGGRQFFFFWIRLIETHPTPILPQEETRRAEHATRTMSERTIDAQRASAPVPR